MVFSGISDGQGMVKFSFLPAAVNRIRVFESDFFCSKEEELPVAKMTPPGKGVTHVALELVPKAQASVLVRVFVMPVSIPKEADDADGGFVDWSLCDEPLEPLSQAVVELLPFDEETGSTQAPVLLRKDTDDADQSGTFESGLVQEGAVELSVRCEGYKPHRQPLLLLVGENRFNVPMEPLCG